MADLAAKADKEGQADQAGQAALAAQQDLLGVRATAKLAPKDLRAITALQDRMVQTGKQANLIFRLFLDLDLNRILAHAK